MRQLRDFVISEAHISDGLLQIVRNTNLVGRWQILQEHPTVICDTAHNKEGLRLTLGQLKRESYQKLHIVLGMVVDKKLEDILCLFPTNASYYFCKPDIPRGMPSEELQEKAASFFLLGKAFSSVNEATTFAIRKASKKDLIYVGGSTFVVAEII